MATRAVKEVLPIQLVGAQLIHYWIKITEITFTARTLVHVSLSIEHAFFWGSECITSVLSETCNLGRSNVQCNQALS